MALSLSFLNVDTLNAISYNRSRKWGSFFDKYKNTNESIEIPVNDVDSYIENTLTKYDDDDDSNESSEDDSNSNTEIDIESMLDNACRNVKTKADCTHHRIVVDNDDDDHKLQDMLDATLPILVEHKLQCQRAGIDRILNTFDTNKIEKKVGGWLRRNQSGFIGPNSTALSGVSYRHPYAEMGKLSRIESESDSDSLHSFDTARYIKASKKNCDLMGVSGGGCSGGRGGGGGRCLNSDRTSTTIKSYRNSQSKRDALREKYAMDDHDQDELFVKALRHRRRRREQQQLSQLERADAYNEREHAALADRVKNGRMQTSRRKHMHKLHTVHAPDDDDYDDDDLSSLYDSASSIYVTNNRKHISGHKSRSKPRDYHLLRGLREDMRCRSLAYVKRLHRQRLNRTLSSSSSFLSTYSCGSAKHREKHSNHASNDRECDHFHRNNQKSNRQFLCSPLADNIASTKLKIRHPMDEGLNAGHVHQEKKSKRKKLTANEDIKNHLELLDIKKAKENGVSKAKPRKRKSPNNGKMGNEGDAVAPTKKKTQSKTTKKQASKRSNNKQQTDEFIGDLTLEDHLQIAMQLSKDAYLQDESKKADCKTSENEFNCDGNHKNDGITEEFDQQLPNVNGERCDEDEQMIEANNKQPQAKTIKSTVTAKKTKTTAKNKKAKPLSRQKNRHNDEEEKQVEMEEQIRNNNSDACNNRNTAQKSQSICVGNHPLNAIYEINSENEHDKPAESDSKPNENQNDVHAVAADIYWSDDDNDLTINIKLKPQPKSAKIRRKLQLLNEAKCAQQNGNVTTDGAFTKMHNFRNSTALANDTAINREIDGEKCTTSTTSNNNDKDDDCAVVSSSNDVQPSNHSNSQSNNDRILLYTPAKRHTVPVNSLLHDRFVITKEHLATVIGERSAQKFVKYYVGRRIFSNESTVYYKPPKDGLQALECSDESDVDPLDLIDQCGDLCESFKDVK